MHLYFAELITLTEDNFSGVILTPMMAGMRDDIKESLAAGVPFPKRLGHPGKNLEILLVISTGRLWGRKLIRPPKRSQITSPISDV